MAVNRPTDGLMLLIDDHSQPMARRETGSIGSGDNHPASGPVLMMARHPPPAEAKRSEMLFVVSQGGLGHQVLSLRVSPGNGSPVSGVRGILDKQGLTNAGNPRPLLWRRSCETVAICFGLGCMASVLGLQWEPGFTWTVGRLVLAVLSREMVGKWSAGEGPGSAPAPTVRLCQEGKGSLLWACSSQSRSLLWHNWAASARKPPPTQTIDGFGGMRSPPEPTWHLKVRVT